MRIRKNLFVLFCAFCVSMVFAGLVIARSPAATPQETLQHLIALQNEGKIDAALEGYLALIKIADERIAAYAHFFAGQILLAKNQPQAANPHLQTALSLAQAHAKQEKAFAQLALYSRFQLGVAAAMEEKRALAREEFLLCLRQAESEAAGYILLIEQTHLELLRLALQEIPLHNFDIYFNNEISPHIAPFLRKPHAAAATNPAELAVKYTLRLDAARALLDIVLPINTLHATADLALGREVNERLASLALRLAGLYIAELGAGQDRDLWLFERARAETALSRYTNALVDINSLANKNADALILEANIHIRMGNEERALDLLKNASRKAQGSEGRFLTGQYAHLLLQARRYAEAAPLLEELIAREAPDTFTHRQALLDLASLALAADDAPLAERRIRASGVTNSAGMRLLTAALIAQGKTGEAAQNIEQALAAARSPREGAELAILEASLAYTAGEFEHAGRAAARAEELAGLAHMPRIEAEALVLAALSMHTNTEAAAALLLRAQNIATAYGLTQAEANIRHNLAVLALSLNKNDEAIRGFLQALELFDRTRARFAFRSEERLQYTASWSETQRFLALAYLAAGRHEDAWEAYEHSLAREAREALAESLLRSSADFADNVRTQERALEALQRAQAAGAPREEIEKRMRALSESAQKVELWLRVQDGMRNPNDASTADSPARPDLKTFSQALKQNGAVALQYLIWPDEKPGIVFVIDGDGLYAAQLPPSDEILRAAARFRDIASRPLLERVWDPQTLGTRLIDHRMSFVTNGLALNDILIEPIYTRGQNSQISNILIIADGELASFPFAALPLPDDRWNSGRNWPYCLGDEIPIMTAVSASAWLQAELIAHNTGAIILAGDVGERALPTPSGSGRIMPALPGSGREIDGIARIFGQRARIARGSDATPERLTALLRESPAILHLATHGFFLTNASTGRLYGALLLAENAPPNAPRHGAIPRGSIFDETAIARLPLVGSLVTLSACESARGRTVAGEGMLSLMRAFIMAGAKNVSASLWIIGDDSAAEYMVRYYRHIAAGARPSAAHRDTRRELYELGFWPSQRSGFITSN